MKKILLLCLLLLLSMSLISFASVDPHAEVAFDGAYWNTQLVKFVNIGLVIGILFFFLSKPVKAFFQNRAKQIEEDLSAAARARQEAERRLEEVKLEVAELENKVESIKASAVEEGEAEKQRLISQARHESGRLISNAEREIENRIKSGKSELKSYATKLAVEKARMMIHEDLSDSENNKIIDETLKSIGGAN